MVSDVSRYQSNVTYQPNTQGTAETQRLRNQQQYQYSAENRRADSVENRPQATLSYLGSNIDIYA